MRALVSERAAVGWSSFRLDGTFLWTHAILPASNVTPYLRPLSGAGRSRRPPRTCAALSVPARCTWAAASWPAAAIMAPQALAARIRSLPSPFTVTVELQIRVLHRRRDLARVRTTPGKR